MNRKLIGYYPNWSQWHTKMRPSQIRAEMYTHLNYAFAMINEKFELTAFEENDEELYREFNVLKLKNTKLKTLLAVGGWNFNTPGWTNKQANDGKETYKIFSDMMQWGKNRRAFATQAGKFLRARGFDGLDLDWEYPGALDRGGRENDGEKLVKFCELFKKINPDLLLTMAAPAGPHHFEKLPLKELSDHLDWFNLMSYDFSGHSWSEKTGGHSRLIVESQEEPFSGSAAAAHYILDDVPPEKIIYGLACYGRAFGGVEGLTNTDFGPGKKHNVNMAPDFPVTRQVGHAGYSELIPLVENDIYELGRPPKDDYTIAYSPGRKEWIGFDLPVDIERKAKYIKDQGLGGAMFWSIDMDLKEESMSLVEAAYLSLNIEDELEKLPIKEEPKEVPKEEDDGGKEEGSSSEETGGGQEEDGKEESSGHGEDSREVTVDACGPVTIKIVVNSCCKCGK